MRKLVIILIVFIAVVTFIRAFPVNIQEVEDVNALSATAVGSGGAAALGSGVIARPFEETVVSAEDADAETAPLTDTAGAAGN